MDQSFKPLYCCALRMKAGEIEGVGQLSPETADCVLPRFIVPPQSERDERQPLLIEIDEIPDISRALSTYWRGRPVLIDSTYIIDEYGRDRLESWLPNMFERARNDDVRAIPAVLLSDIVESQAAAFRRSVAHNELIKFAICIPAGEMVGTEFKGELNQALKLLELDVMDCAVIADFSDSEFSQPEIVAPIIAGALETLQDLGPWQLIIFQGTNFPEKNPAGHNSVEIWPRNEWKAWCRAVKFDPSTAKHMTFGDYAADCARMVFSKGRSQAIRHLRYTAGATWLVQRAAEHGPDKERMQSVCKKIVESGQFAGGGFSAADTFIQRMANGLAGPGTAKTWRQLNTTHHITHVVNEIAKVRGVVLPVNVVDEPATQFELLG